MAIARSWVRRHRRSALRRPTRCAGAVERAPEVVQRDFAGGAFERYFGSAGDKRIGIVEERKSHSAPVALLAPVRHPGNGLCDPSCARVFDQFEPVSDRIDPSLYGDLVDKRLDRKLVCSPADAAQRGRAHARVPVYLLDQLMRDAVAAEIAPGHQDEVLAAARFIAHRIEGRRHSIAYKPMMIDRQLARAVEPGP